MYRLVIEYEAKSRAAIVIDRLLQLPGGHVVLADLPRDRPARVVTGVERVDHRPATLLERRLRAMQRNGLHGGRIRCRPREHADAGENKVPVDSEPWTARR